MQTTVARVSTLFVLGALGAGQARAADLFAQRREQMVEYVIIGQGIMDERVIEVMGKVPRHEFMPRDQREKAYNDEALPIGEGQTISPPFVVASMTEHLQPKPSDKVLEIGTGSGYQAAVLSGLVKDVYTIEIQKPLGELAEQRLRRLGYKNVHTRIGDGFKGWAEAAPFDKIIVTCSPEKIPQPLIDQLADGGRMMIPVGQRFQQVLYLYTKKGDKLEEEAVEGTMFVPMTGTAEERREVHYDSAHPHVVNGSFEEATIIDGVPDGWYYARQATLEKVADAPDGKQVLTFTNAQPGKLAQILQGFGVDGGKVKQLDVRLWFRAKNVQPPQGLPNVRPQLVVSYYNTNRGEIGHATIGLFAGTTGWTEKRQRLSVPRDARLAVLFVGMGGATGQVSVDNLSIKAVEPKSTDVKATQAKSTDDKSTDDK